MPQTFALIRQRMHRFGQTAHAVKRLHDTGFLDLGNLGITLETARNARVYGAQAAIAIQGGRKFPSQPAVVDERCPHQAGQGGQSSSPAARPGYPRAHRGPRFRRWPQ